MPKIAGVATALPQYVLRQEEIKSFATSVFGAEYGVDKLLQVFDNALIEERHFVVDFEWFESKHTFTEVNDRYIEEALRLSKEVTLLVSADAGIRSIDFDLIIFVSTTGLSTPSIEARLFNELPFDPHVKRLPVWGLGCAGGAAGIARAHDYALAYPDAKVLVLAVELCGLAFQSQDRSKSNVIASALFGDGAAAVVVVGDGVETKAGSPSTILTLSTTYPDTLDVMGWKVTAEGFRVVLSKDIPTIVRTLVGPNVEELLARARLSRTDLKYLLPHPGGKKVLDAFIEVLGIESQSIDYVYHVLRRCGNMSSPTVLFILEEFLRTRAPLPGEYGLVSALGPGFSSELVLLKW